MDGVRTKGPQVSNLDVNTIMLAIIAISNAVTAWLWYHNNQKMTSISQNITTVEKATNSMKDHLVMATASAAEAKGFALGQAAGIKSADIASAKIADAVVTARNKP